MAQSELKMKSSICGLEVWLDISLPTLSNSDWCEAGRIVVPVFKFGNMFPKNLKYASKDVGPLSVVAMGRISRNGPNWLLSIDVSKSYILPGFRTCQNLRDGKLVTKIPIQLSTSRKMVMRKYGGVNPDSAFDVEKDGNEEVCGAESRFSLFSFRRRERW